MKTISLAAALATLALCGAAGAQEQLRPAGGFEPPAATSGANAYDTHNSERTAAVRRATDQYRLACKADGEALCADKASGRPMLRCLNYHRLTVSSPCKAAMTTLSMTQQGRL
jgi:hypothetical protein